LSIEDAGFQVAVFDFLEGEERKNLTTVQKAYEFLVKQDLTRSDGIVALGGGVVGGSLVLLGGDPGIGKSTLLLQISAYLAKEHDVLYVTGEESVRQVKIRADRLKNNTDELFVYAQTDLNLIYQVVKKIKPQFLVIDSIQTIYNPNLENSPGSITQVRECTQQLMKIAKDIEEFKTGNFDEFVKNRFQINKIFKVVQGTVEERKEI